MDVHAPAAGLVRQLDVPCNSRGNGAAVVRSRDTFSSAPGNRHLRLCQKVITDNLHQNRRRMHLRLRFEGVTHLDVIVDPHGVGIVRRGCLYGWQNKAQLFDSLCDGHAQPPVIWLAIIRTALEHRCLRRLATSLERKVVLIIIIIIF